MAAGDIVLELEPRPQPIPGIPSSTTELDQNDTFSLLRTSIDKLSSRGSDKLSSKGSHLSSYSSISKVPRQLLEVKETAYTPQLISIGPYHHGRDGLQAMEIHKILYLKDLLRRKGNYDDELLRHLVNLSRDLEEEARHCYEGPLDMSSAKFVAMLVLDGCFVVELIHKFKNTDDRGYRDHIFKHNLNLNIVSHDLLLLENQLPFFVLNKLYASIHDISDVYSDEFRFLAVEFFSDIMPGQRLEKRRPRDDFEHLLDLVHFYWHSESELSTPKTNVECKFMRTATELLEVGIKFKKSKRNDLFGITFENGTLYIPTLSITYDTERIFRNLIAFEYFNNGLSIVMDYSRLMDSLINCAEDVALLSHAGIIDNWLGSNQAVADMINKLNDYVYLSTSNFHYSKIFYDVNKYYRGRWNMLKLELKTRSTHNHWDWVLYSIIAATFLLLLSVTQTVFAILDYLK